MSASPVLHLNLNFLTTHLSLPSSCKIRRRNRESRGGVVGWCYMSSTRPTKEDAFVFSYKKFIDLALEETRGRTELSPSPLQKKFNSFMGMDGLSELQMLSYEAPKVRLFRCLSIEGNDGMKVLDLAVFPRPEFDLPIFCANFFTAANTNIVVLDLNPLHCVITQDDYKEKYYRDLIPLGLKYSELLPWGGKLTSESLRFFSPIVIWTKFSSSESKYSTLFSAFKDYYEAWLELMDQTAEETDASQIVRNRVAQHRYLRWRAEKDPGRGVLTRLVGEALSEEIVRSFLFNGVDELGRKTFLDYFPEYRSEDGKINEKRSMIGKSFAKRPWDSQGNFVDQSFR